MKLAETVSQILENIGKVFGFENGSKTGQISLDALTYRHILVIILVDQLSLYQTTHTYTLHV